MTLYSGQNLTKAVTAKTTAAIPATQLSVPVTDPLQSRYASKSASEILTIWSIFPTFFVTIFYIYWLRFFYDIID